MLGLIFAASINAQTVLDLRIAIAGMGVAGARVPTHSALDENRVVPAADLPVSAQEASTPSGIVYTCDPGIAALAGICSTLNSATAGLYAGIFTNANANIYITLASTGGDLGMSHFLLNRVAYSAFRSALQSSLSSANDATAFNDSVPATNPINSNSDVLLSLPNMRALGLTPSGGIQPDGTICQVAGPGCYDGIITISSEQQSAGRLYFRAGSIGFSQYDFYTIVEHETDEILGTASCAFTSCGGSHIHPADLFRFQSNGTRSFGAGNNSPCTTSNTGNACFSIDGVHMLQHYYNVNDGYDAGDWVPNCAAPLVQSAGCPGVANVDISPAAEILVLDMVGYTLTGSFPDPLTVTTKVTSTTIGVVNGVCTPPPPVSSFTTLSPQVWFYFGFTGAKAGDSAQVQFIRPDGVLYATSNTSIAIAGTGCVSKNLAISGTSAASFPGIWSIRVTWNGSSTPLFILNFTVTLASCDYSLSNGGEAFSAPGGSGTIGVTTSPGCAWNAIGAPAWLIVTNGSGTGSGIVSFLVLSNAGAGRIANLSIGGAAFVIEQEAAFIPGLNLIGSLPHIAAEENWTTTLTLVNKGASSAVARLSLFGDPNGPLSVPLLFPQQPGTEGPILAATLDQTLAANSSLIITTAGPQNPPVEIGSAQLAATGAVDGFAIFHLIPGAQEAVVPMEARNASSYLLAFDNTGGVGLGVAVENISAQAATIPVVIRDESGNLIADALEPVLSLAGNGHTSFLLSTQYPVTDQKRGTIEFDTPAGGRISVLGIRTTPLGSSNALTTIPPLANVGSDGGSVAQIATGNGWQTTFVLVNTGVSAAQASLNFFDDNGAPLPLPLGFPQSGSGTTTTNSNVSQVLAAGATLIVESHAPESNPAPTVGSAQLTANGHIGGFVIFRYNLNGQEAVVPLESRNASAYLVAFDNTNGTATGVALNSVSAQPVNIPVIVRDDTGAQIATDTIALSANGHIAFTLAIDKYPATANIRGTIEFDAPAGAQIGTLGIRIPAAHTFTTLPALMK